MVSPVITGYYRYTDIFFEWHQALPEADRSPLRASLAQDAFVHPDHPLHKEGVDGAELFLGTLQNFETRLLFSSAQVEYLRYWLHAMGLTENLISLPYSDCLLTESSLRHVTPVIFKTKDELKGALKQIEKNNKRLKGADPMLKTRREIFERVRTLWVEKVGVWCALDFEAWDRDHTMLTEFGWSFVRWIDGQQVEEQGHLIVKEYRHYTNTFVQNNREHFSFGDSELVNRATFRTRIQNLVADLQKYGPLFLIFHDNNQDIKYLKSAAVNADLPNLNFLLPDAKPDSGVFVLDTSDLFAALEGEGGHNRRSLERVCRHLQVPTSFLHNAGNDAHYTLLAIKEMASGDPLDMQREKRWPNRTGNTAYPTAPQTGAGVKVKFEPWEEDSDYSDTEGVGGPIIDKTKPEEQVVV
ncbi:hypothetical protein F4604DRAFT_1565189 [Suillus subluteus]|nr:hypothetical protein F4604DRAFT_1565189 [Suillus subluteus]